MKGGYIVKGGIKIRSKIKIRKKIRSKIKSKSRRRVVGLGGLCGDGLGVVEGGG